jgi:hypothetical protein
MSTPTLDDSERAVCLDQGISGANFFSDQSPLPATCPLTPEGARNLAETAGIYPSRLDAAAIEVMRHAAERWGQIKSNRRFDAKTEREE